jgi:hypothetical protein
MSEYLFVPLDLSNEGINKTASFLGGVFSKPSLFVTDLLRWQYVLNPCGNAIGYNAFTQNGELVAHYAVQPFTAILNGKEIKASLSLNTATAKKHQGKKLFTTLAELAYEEAAEKGIELIVGVANRKSIHGLEKKLGFINYGPLSVAVGFNKPLEIFPDSKTSFQIKRTNEELEWRLSHPLKKYSLFQKNGALEVLSNSGYWNIQIQMAVLNNVSVPTILVESKQNRSLFKVWIGLDPSFTTLPKGFLNVPIRFRPSPLYLSMKKLSDTIQLPIRSEILFQAIDFDAY